MDQSQLMRVSRWMSDINQSIDSQNVQLFPFFQWMESLKGDVGRKQKIGSP